jgi:hypothetical protein
MGVVQLILTYLANNPHFFDTKMRKLISIVLVVFFTTNIMFSEAFASSSLSIGLLGGKGRTPTVLPGETYIQTVSITAPSEANATDVVLEILGFGETADAGVLTLDVSKDIGNFSARQYINPEKSTLHVEPGETKTTDLTITIPQDPGDGGRYATLLFTSSPTGQGGIGVVTAMVITMKFTIANSNLIHTGKILSLDTSSYPKGKPIQLSAIISNTGNHHYKINGEVQVVNLNGEIIDTLPFTNSSPIPGGNKCINIEYVPKDLQLGIYKTKWSLNLEDGSAIDSAEGSFEIIQDQQEATNSNTIQPTSTQTPEAILGEEEKHFSNKWILFGGALLLVIIIFVLILIIRGKKH